MRNLAPILLFTFKRLETLHKGVEALSNNPLACESDLYIFSDAAKKPSDQMKVNEVRTYLKTINGFKTITIFEENLNKGLANSIIEGVTKIIKLHGKVIVLEDDLVVSRNFLSFMNQGLIAYQNQIKVFSLAGYTTPIKNADKDIYFTLRSSSWGWATWENRWVNIDWEMETYDKLRKMPHFKKSINKMGSDMYKMLGDQAIGKINSWAIRWCYHQFLNNSYTVYPTLSKVINIGTDNSATHTRDRFNRFKTILDETDQSEFIFNQEVEIDNFYLYQFLKQFSISTRIKYKLLNLLPS